MDAYLAPWWMRPPYPRTSGYLLSPVKPTVVAKHIVLGAAGLDPSMDWPVTQSTPHTASAESKKRRRRGIGALSEIKHPHQLYSGAVLVRGRKKRIICYLSSYTARYLNGQSYPTQALMPGLLVFAVLNQNHKEQHI
jgi:hypothetical protein